MPFQDVPRWVDHFLRNWERKSLFENRMPDWQDRPIQFQLAVERLYNCALISLIMILVVLIILGLNWSSILGARICSRMLEKRPDFRNFVYSMGKDRWLQMTTRLRQFLDNVVKRV